MKLSTRRLRLKAVWLIVLPYFWFASPTPRLFAVGVALALLGLFIRGWSAGTIHKDREITTGGPYAHTRNPLYLGSFFMGLGAAVAGGHWIWPVVFVAFYAVAYTRAIREEQRNLAERFPEAYARYAGAVPVFLPRPVPWRDPEGQGAGGFGWQQYSRNREYEAALGVLATFAILMAKMVLTA